MNRLRNLWADWIRALGRAPWRTQAPDLRVFRRRARRLDARGLQGMLADAFGRRAAPPAVIEEPPRKAVGS